MLFAHPLYHSPSRPTQTCVTSPIVLYLLSIRLVLTFFLIFSRSFRKFCPSWSFTRFPTHLILTPLLRLSVKMGNLNLEVYKITSPSMLLPLGYFTLDGLSAGFLDRQSPVKVSESYTEIYPAQPASSNKGAAMISLRVRHGYLFKTSLQVLFPWLGNDSEIIFPHAEKPATLLWSDPSTNISHPNSRTSDPPPPNPHSGTAMRPDTKKPMNTLVPLGMKDGIASLFSIFRRVGTLVTDRYFITVGLSSAIATLAFAVPSHANVSAYNAHSLVVTWQVDFHFRYHPRPRGRPRSQ